MRDLWHLFRGSVPRLGELNYAYEKAGLTVENEPIPLGADCILIEAVVELPHQVTHAKGDFELHLNGQTVYPESQRIDGPGETTCLQFRLSVPVHSSSGELIWRGRSIGQVFLPILDTEEFTKKFSLRMPTASVRIGDRVVACQTFVTTQCQGLIVSGLLQSSTSLAPILDLGLRVEIHRQEGGPVGVVAVQLTSSQLKARQALVSVVPPKPKRLGTWYITWYLGDKPLASHVLKAISQKQFIRSLRVSSTRFVLQKKGGGFKIERFLPDFEDVLRAGPCFLVSSSETGMAGRCIIQVHAQVKGPGEPPLLQEQEVLLTDGPLPFIPGTVEIEDLENVKHFELRCGRQILGTLPLSPIPTAAFTQEGGFMAPDSFDWSPTAEEQFQERLGKLLGP